MSGVKRVIGMSNAQACCVLISNAIEVYGKEFPITSDRILEAIQNLDLATKAIEESLAYVKEKHGR